MKRWDLTERGSREPMEETPNGDWVLHEDASAEVRELQAQVDCSVGPFELQIERLRGELSLAEEGLANYAQELARAQSVNAEFHNVDDVAEIRRLQAERAAAIDRLTPLGCEVTRLRTALEEIAKHRLRGRKTQGALLAEEALKGDI